MSARTLWAAVRARERAARTRTLVRLLERTTSRSPVIVPEYSFRPRARWGWEEPPPERLARILAEAEPDAAETVAAALELRDWCQTIPRSAAGASGHEPYWDNDYWGGLDAVVQVAELKRRNPALYLEVGSGHSTRFARRAIDDFSLRTRIVSIDPSPRAEVDALCDEVVRSPAEDAPEEVWRGLAEGDVLFVDGSHMALMGSDATVLLCEVLPRLPAGVMVQIDDIFLPWDYPPTWNRRWYGEQYVLAGLLLGGAAGWRIRFAGWHLTQLSQQAQSFAPLWPLVETRFGRVASSFWIERDGDDL